MPDAPCWTGSARCAPLYPDAVITVDGGDIGFGSGSGYQGLVFVVAPHNRHVTLGIAGGANPPDPAGLMEDPVTMNPGEDDPHPPAVPASVE